MLCPFHFSPLSHTITFFSLLYSLALPSLPSRSCHHFCQLCLVLHVSPIKIAVTSVKHPHPVTPCHYYVRYCLIIVITIVVAFCTTTTTVISTTCHKRWCAWVEGTAMFSISTQCVGRDVTPAMSVAGEEVASCACVHAFMCQVGAKESRVSSSTLSSSLLLLLFFLMFLSSSPLSSSLSPFSLFSLPPLLQ